MAVVTGAASGIGLGLSGRFAADAEQFDRLALAGASPAEVAAIVADGIRSSRFYILTSVNRNGAVARRGEEIVCGGPPASPFP